VFPNANANPGWIKINYSRSLPTNHYSISQPPRNASDGIEVLMLLLLLLGIAGNSPE
jgi:hypothetical protein